MAGVPLTKLRSMKPRTMLCLYVKPCTKQVLNISYTFASYSSIKETPSLSRNSSQNTCP